MHRAATGLLAAIVTTALAVGAGVLLPGLRDAERAAPAVSPASARAAAVADSGAERQARTVLATWDLRRADAWAHGDARALGRLYAAGSVAGRRDAAMLERWSARGLRVDGLATQLLDLAVVEQGPTRLVLDVTDRVGGGEAVGDGVRVDLPSDRPTRRRISLRVVAGEWRVASVRPLG
ncbi:hypothetical protein [Nocardioides pantholopis]|uniref:hypothetical protein n=1 Tax=Nocardioides pantholopis TaxID=2483798 RepID=UPI000FD9F57E|nr:hypothetical protein [Nocardioides pantholopis]